mmetsp:Transcript_10844/g.24600  ORF Transcript_10844/g.24600 Transcript_10844/m.24600 type:complete len:144 (-) Transcript_10844:371-802(-)|eukprot:CAMPEP_0201123734 /NCGR_PEP_ID=MMETSP0850-20130426/9058_1 /ASSEMBLY_ACC=CAM_ASM_000622 /TAXON_ID=183588 /ORGANISM="Pseudo-nitzschia fraudulenta, Strain WWA7" /LENGTH=143 /DNA_ID=CAMNT_0047390801 /DNA_START=68 /DNA_END=499 /DNA_ORIENTATION=+
MFGVANILRKTTTLAFVGSTSLSRQQQQHASVGTLLRRGYGRSASALQATKYLLKYDYVPDVLEKRGPYREQHIVLANRFIDEGSCLSGGPTLDVGTEVPKGALFVFTDAGSARKYAEGDPYVANGIVKEYCIEEWNVVVEKK